MNDPLAQLENRLQRLRPRSLSDTAIARMAPPHPKYAHGARRAWFFALAACILMALGIGCWLTAGVPESPVPSPGRVPDVAQGFLPAWQAIAIASQNMPTARAYAAALKVSDGQLDALLDHHARTWLKPGPAEQARPAFPIL